MSGGHVLLVDDDEDIRLSLTQTLELRGHDVTACARAERALDIAGPDFPGVVVSDIRMPGMGGLGLLDALRAVDPDLPVVLITGHGDVPMAVDALGRGASDFIEKPFSQDRLAHTIARALETRRMALEIRALRAPAPPGDLLEAALPGQSPAMVALKRKLPTIAESRLDVLITGPTGTGKDRVARAIHDLGGGQRPFVTINLAALPEAHVEAELFGHVAGALPGAPRGRTGRLEHGRGGTIFLDEIGSAPPALQAKLLRVLEDRAVTPLGASDAVPLEARFIASSRADLEAAVADGAFRDDLLYRINPVTLRLPPLSERSGDIPDFFLRFVTEAAQRYDRPVPDVPPARLMDVAARPWPGNLRELRNVADLFVLGLEESAASPEPGGTLSDRMEAFERRTLAEALAAHAGNLRATYESLGLARKTLYEKMQKHGLRREDFTA